MSRYSRDRFAKPEPVDLTAFAKIADERAKLARPRRDIEREMFVAQEPEREQKLIESGIRDCITAEDFDALRKGKTRLKTHALESVQRWYAERPTSLRPMVFWTLVGPTGRGKTVAGGWLIAHIGGAYLSAEDACKLFRAPAHSRAAAKWEELMLKRVLVLDDLGTERDADDAVAMLNNLVNRRQGLSTGWTLMTANLTKAEYLARYDERTIRRVEHQGVMVVVRGEDLRRKGTL